MFQNFDMKINHDSKLWQKGVLEEEFEMKSRFFFLCSGKIMSTSDKRNHNIPEFYDFSNLNFENKSKPIWR